MLMYVRVAHADVHGVNSMDGHALPEQMVAHDDAAQREAPRHNCLPWCHAVQLRAPRGG
jgi:hypothetical protein